MKKALLSAVIILQLMIAGGCTPQERATDAAENTPIPDGAKIIAVLPDIEATLYASKEQKGLYRGLILEIGNKRHSVNWSGCSGYSPELHLADLNGDGKKELVIFMITSIGSSKEVIAAHVVKPDTLSQYPVDDPLKVIAQHIDTQITSRQIKINLDQNNILIDKQRLSAQPKDLFDRVEFGKIVYFTLDSKLHAHVPAEISPNGFIGRIDITYAFKNGKFQAESLKFKQGSL